MKIWWADFPSRQNFEVSDDLVFQVRLFLCLIAIFRLVNKPSKYRLRTFLEWREYIIQVFLFRFRWVSCFLGSGTKVIFMTESDVFGIYESMILFCSIGTRIKLMKDLINGHSHVGGKKTPISSIRSSLN